MSYLHSEIKKEPHHSSVMRSFERKANKIKGDDYEKPMKQEWIKGKPINNIIA